MTTVQRRGRFRFSFRLRTMLGLVATAAVGLALFSYGQNWIWERHESFLCGFLATVAVP